MVLYQHKRAVGLFTNWSDVRQALHELKQASFPLNQVSVIAREIESRYFRPKIRFYGNHGGEGAATGALAGGAVGGIVGLLVGIGALAIPLIGPVMLASAVTTTVATTLAGGAIGVMAGGILGLLIGLGVPEERAKIYQERFLEGDYLVIVEGTDREIRSANSILKNRGIQEWMIYDAPEIHSANPEFPVTPADYSHFSTR
ncbi:MAG: DUF1269 domain-containing protein [Cyanobacteriota bacterium]